MSDTGEREHIKSAKFKDDKKPLTPWTHPMVAQFSRGYIRHLFMANEMLAMRLLTLHNLTYMYRLMGQIREAIAAGKFAQFARKFGYTDAELAKVQGCGMRV